MQAKTFKALGILLWYPNEEWLTGAADVCDLIEQEALVSKEQLANLRSLVAQLQESDLLDLQEEYVDTFDRVRSLSLHLFEHVHGDSRDRGPAMIDLAQTYEKAGLYLAPEELPDYLPVVLQFVSTQPAREAHDFLAEMAHILNAIFNALQQRGSLYAGVLGALLELAGEKAQAVKIPVEAPLDESWEEPIAFDGCSVQGQAKAGQPQPIHIVKKSSSPTAGVSQ